MSSGATQAIVATTLAAHLTPTPLPAPISGESVVATKDGPLIAGGLDSSRPRSRRSLGEEVGGWFANLHLSEGVRVMTGAMLEGARGKGRVEELTLAGGEAVACGAVVVGVGTSPATARLPGSGLDESGVRTDTSGRARLPGVFAAGDASVPFDPRFGAHARTEHWDAAAWQGAAGTSDARRVPRHPTAAELLERPVRAADPVRPTLTTPTQSWSRASAAGATSKPSSPAAASRLRAWRSAVPARSQL